ncbi:DUF4064 domain-containing protein [Microbacterium sp. APC 3898]|uniref:DUF4064 domain-containing protein n=1 Tax=Planococcus notacanthi TaxID=3035188 RepID=A0ABT7ZM72_9BACL|nr:MULTISPECIES: DUF4064 domain-containing protein [Terrabacteria group]MDN3428249.1 DUF4064 domain-containing protein [Planococcus sp. APC 4016]MDN3498213.1 DUF4064 domain-containing protein [Microbacterium sp. APC 3898]
MNQETVNRAGEKVLGIIGIVFNILAIALIGFGMASYSSVQGTPEFQQYIEDEIMADPAFSNPEEAQMVIDMMSSSFNIVGWVLIALLALSTIFAIVALVNLRKRGKASMAGVFFILAGLFAGLLSLTSILFYIAAIMCFVRKPRASNNQNLRDDDFKYQEDQLRRKEESVRREDELRRDDTTTTRNDDDTPYRPL